MSVTHPAQIVEVSGGVSIPLGDKLDSLDASILALQTLLPTWDDLARPYVMGHRGTTVLAPENTLSAFDVAAAGGFPIETDVVQTLDHQLIIMHDFTPDRTTGIASGLDIRNQTSNVLRTLDVSGILPGPGNIFVPQRVPMFEEYLRRYRGNLLIPEVKDERSVTGTAMATFVKKYGMQRSVVITCFSQNALDAVKAVDPSIRTLLAGQPPITAAYATAHNLWGVSSDVPEITAGYVTGMRAVGVQVHAYNTLGLAANIDAMVAAGVDGIYAEDAIYCQLCITRTPTGTTTIDPPITPFQGSGWLFYSTVGAYVPAVVSGYLTFSGGTLGAGTFFRIHLPVRTANTPTTQTINTTLKAVQVPADTSRWLGIRVCWDKDDDNDWNGGVPAPSHQSSGYFLGYRANGSAELNKLVNGTNTLLASATWATYATGATFPIRVNVTATSITFTRTDNGQTVTANDATLARGGFVMAVGSGSIPGIASTTLTY